MKKRTFTRFVLLVLIGLGCAVSGSNAQTPWSGAYGNEWIVEGQEYAVIKVKAKGVYQINKSDLPAQFPAFDSGKLQLWHRGKQVAILEQDANKVVFYGVPNDGIYDELLARPDANRPEIVGRMNKYVSFFSEHSFYFLTVDSRNIGAGFVPPVGVQTVNLDNLPTATATESYHVKTDTLLFTNEFSTTVNFSTFPTYFNSFYDYGQTFTGARQLGNAVFLRPFTIKNFNSASGQPIKVKVLMHNRSKINSNIDINVRAKGGMNRLVSTVALREFKGTSYEFVLNSASDINANGEGEITFSINNGTVGNFYSVSFISFEYPQNLNVDGKNLYTISLPSALNSEVYQITLSNLPSAQLKLLDITSVDLPIVYNTSNSASFRYKRTQNEQKNILAYAAEKSILPANISRYVGQSINYSNYKDKDYIVITTKALESAAKRYSSYRAGTYNRNTKDTFKVFTITVEDIYNQYSYGEPTPVGIRRFIDFMLSDRNFNKSLFLIGNSNNLNKGVMELTDQVPTIGFPGSDFLLVSGLGGAREDFQTISVGRLPVGTNAKIDDYLGKVKQYENYNDLAPKTWRKNVVHYSGGKSSQEIINLREALKFASDTYVIPNGGTTFTYTKDVANPCPPDANGFTDCQTYASPEIAGKVNEGAGVLTYYGHGNARVTDYYAGYVTDPGRGFSDAGKYPGYFLYGCDVNNVFVGNNENISYNLTNSTKRPFTIDWLITPNRGAITVVGNSWEGYESILTPYMDKVYEKLFVSDLNKMMLGDILKTVSNNTMGNLSNPVAINSVPYNYNFVQANVHQTMLLGDPAIILMLQQSPSSLPVSWLNISAKVSGVSKVTLEWSTANEINNERFIIQRSKNGKQFEDIGSVDGQGTSSYRNDYTYNDNSALWGRSYYRIVQLDSPTSQNESGISKSRIVSVENGSGDYITIFPNPSSNLINVSSYASAIASWQLLDELGRILHSGKGKGEISLGSLEKGTYFIKIETSDGEVITKRFVKGTE